MSASKSKASSLFDPRNPLRWLWHTLRDKLNGDWFELAQRHGLHTKLVHYYSPIPDTRELNEAFFTRASELPGVDMRDEEQLSLVQEFGAYRGELEQIARGRADSSSNFGFENTFYTGLDAALLYSMLRKYQPRRVIEVGSGFSTRLTALALERNVVAGAPTPVFTAIEPYPDKDRGVLGATHVIAKPVQEVDLSLFESLESGDVLFIDSSHVAKQGSDVCFEFLEVLPRLRRGVLVHVHDIFFPHEYPREWVMERHDFWNEQYVLQAFLSGNRDFQVRIASHWLLTKHGATVNEVFGPLSHREDYHAGALWMQRC